MKITYQDQPIQLGPQICILLRNKFRGPNFDTSILLLLTYKKIEKTAAMLIILSKKS